VCLLYAQDLHSPQGNDQKQTVGSAVDDLAHNSGPQNHRDQLAASETIPIQA